MTQLTVKDILKRSASAWTLRDKWRSVLEDAYELVFAGINPYSQDKKDPRTMNSQFDSTATHAVVRLANRIINELTPPHDNWAEVKAGGLLEMKYSPEQIEELDKMLGGVSKLANVIVNSPSAVASRSSAILDCLISGMGVRLALENPSDDIDPISYQAVSQSEVAIDVNAKGAVSAVYRKRTIKVREIKNIWRDATLTEDLEKLRGSNEQDPEVEVLEVTYEGSPGSNVGWYYEVLALSQAKGGKDASRIVERTYAVSPWDIYRWMVIPGMPYGPGPVLLGLADIRTANKIMEMILKNAALALAGMYMVRDDGIFNLDTFTITEGGIIPVQATGGPMGASIAPLTTNREFDVGNIVLKDLQMAIKRHLYDGTLPPETGQPRSATEWVQRIKDLNADLGAGIGMLINDVTEEVRRVIEVLGKRGYTPPVKIDQLTLKVQISSPLARAQMLSKVERVVQWLQTIISLGGPQAAFVVSNFEKVAKWMADMMGVPVELILTAAEKKQIEQNVAALVAASQAGGQQQVQAA